MTEATHRDWYVIASHELHAALQRVATGDDPDVVLLEIYANSETWSEADRG